MLENSHSSSSSPALSPSQGHRVTSLWPIMNLVYRGRGPEVSFLSFYILMIATIGEQRNKTKSTAHTEEQNLVKFVTLRGNCLLHRGCMHTLKPAASAFKYLDLSPKLISNNHNVVLCDDLHHFLVQLSLLDTTCCHSSVSETKEIACERRFIKRYIYVYRLPGN